MAGKFKIEELLNETEWKEYDALLRRHPAPTIDELWDWLYGHNYRISRGAVWNHKKAFDQRLDEIRAASEYVKAISSATAESQKDTNVAIISLLKQRQMELLVRGLDEGEFTAADLADLAKSVNSAANAEQRFADIKAEYERQKKDAIAAAEKAVATGASGAAVVDTLKRALGITKGAA